MVEGGVMTKGPVHLPGPLPPAPWAALKLVLIKSTSWPQILPRVEWRRLPGFGDSEPACDPGWLRGLPGLALFSSMSRLTSPFSLLSESGSSELLSTLARLLANVFCISSIILAIPPPELLPTVPYCPPPPPPLLKFHLLISNFAKQIFIHLPWWTILWGPRFSRTIVCFL